MQIGWRYTIFLPDPLTTICGSAIFFTIFPNLDYIQYDYHDGVAAGGLKDYQKVKNPILIFREAKADVAVPVVWGLVDPIG
jgi:hypothetical protein